jgi:hypothetical protein
MTSDGTQEFFTREHPNRAAIEALEARIAVDPGACFVRRREELARGVAVWGSNTKELIRHIRLGESNETLQIELIQNLHGTEVRDRYFAKLDQKLHNTLASAVTLVEQTRPFLSHYEEDSAVVVGFDGLKTAITLDASALLESFDWGAVPRQYLLNNPDGVKLGTIVHEYSLAMNNQYEWLIREVAPLHDSEIDEANKLITERNLLLSMGAHADRKSFMDAVNASFIDAINTDVATAFKRSSAHPNS